MDVLELLADKLDPPPIDVLGTLGFEPNCAPRTEARKAGRPLPPFCGQCPQEQFLAATEYDVGYGGALGGGKTFGLVLIGLIAAATYPQITVGAFRRTYPELEANFIKELSRLGFAKKLGGDWKTAKRELHLPNGSVLMCRYCETMADATRYQGAEFQLLLIDERQHMPPDVVEFLKSRIRSGLAHVPVLGLRSTFNPGGIGHASVKTDYVDATDHGDHIVTDPETGRLRRFIPAKATDNPNLNAEYIKDLNSLPPDLRAAFRDGSFDVFAGQVFGEWRHDRHVVPRFTIPPEWRRLAGVDYGYAAPWCTLWMAVDPDGRVWVYRERYETQVGETEQAKRILADEASEPEDRLPARYADPSMWRTTGEGLPIASVYAQNGVALHPANNERIAGWQRVHTYLADGAACRYHRAQGWETCPMLHVLDGTAPNLVRTLPAVPYDKHRVEDVDTDSEDHGVDSLRYALMGIGGGPGEFIWPAEKKTGLDGRPLGERVAGPEHAPTQVTPGPGTRQAGSADPTRTWRRPT